VAKSAISEQRRDDLRHALDAARDAYLQAEVTRDTAARLLEDARIAAPFAGTVDSLLVDIGDFVAPGTPVATLIDLSRARVFAGVTAAQAARLEPGMRTSVVFAALGGLVQAAELRSVGRVANPRDGTYETELWIDAPDPRLRDGLVASIELRDVDDSAQPLAPRAALLRRSGRSEVFVIERSRDGEAIARSREVRTGRSSGDRVEILEGLRDGEKVVVEGHFALRDGSRVTLDEAPAAKARPALRVAPLNSAADTAAVSSPN
jgi:RND family efflux transporter MFP subunit